MYFDKMVKLAMFKYFIYRFIYRTVSFLTFWSPFIEPFLLRLKKWIIDYRSKQERSFSDIRMSLPTTS